MERLERGQRLSRCLVKACRSRKVLRVTLEPSPKARSAAGGECQQFIKWRPVFEWKALLMRLRIP